MNGKAFFISSAQRKKRYPAFPATVGAPSVLVVLVCLCLTVLSVLSLIAARNEFILAERTVSETEQYYRSDAAASAILAEILDQFRQTGAAAAPPGAALTEPEQEKIPENGKTPAFLADYSVPCGENSALYCSVMVYIDGSYDILSWKKVFSAEQTFFDDSINVWDGE